MATSKSTTSSVSPYSKGAHFIFSRSNTEVEICLVHEDSSTVDVQEVTGVIDAVTKKELPKRWWGGVAADEKALLPIPTAPAAPAAPAAAPKE